MVKRLRRCPLTAESAVRFRMGLPKKSDIPWMSFFFWYIPKRKRRGNLLPSFVNLRKQILAVVLRFTEVEKIRMDMQTETATSAWGYILLRCAETTRQLVCRRSSICASKFLPRNSVLRKSRKSEKACKRKRQLPHGATYFFVARNDAATCCRRSSICASKFLP